MSDDEQRKGPGRRKLLQARYGGENAALSLTARLLCSELTAPARGALPAIQVNELKRMRGDPANYPAPRRPPLDLLGQQLGLYILFRQTKRKTEGPQLCVSGNFQIFPGKTEGVWCSILSRNSRESELQS